MERYYYKNKNNNSCLNFKEELTLENFPDWTQEAIDDYVAITEEEFNAIQAELNPPLPEEPVITKPNYDDLVDSLIRERYSISQEFAILRQRDTKPEEFAIYNEYAEQCKVRARELLSENEN